MEPVWVMAGLSISTVIAATGGTWKLMQYRVNKMETKYDNVLFSKDGRLNLVPSLDCNDLRVKCGKDNEKEHSCQAKKLDELKTMVKETNTRLEHFREEQLSFQSEIKVHMQVMASFVERHEKQNL